MAVGAVEDGRLVLLDDGPEAVRAGCVGVPSKSKRVRAVEERADRRYSWRRRR